MTSPEFTRNELVECVEREIKMRERVYQGRVLTRLMTKKFADNEIAKMRAVLEVVKAMPGAVPPQGSLFGERR